MTKPIEEEYERLKELVRFSDERNLGYNNRSCVTHTGPHPLLAQEAYEMMRLIDRLMEERARIQRLVSETIDAPTFISAREKARNLTRALMKAESVINADLSNNAQSRRPVGEEHTIPEPQAP